MTDETPSQMLYRRWQLAQEFTDFLKAHPYLRLYQALTAWSGLTLYAKKEGEMVDTFYWEEKDR